MHSVHSLALKTHVRQFPQAPAQPQCDGGQTTAGRSNGRGPAGVNLFTRGGLAMEANSRPIKRYQAV